jgi:PGF-pre-PGF domain-containing protein
MHQTVNARGDSAISRVTVTGRNVSEIIVTAWIATSPPHNVTLPAGPVYEYIEINMSRCGVISDARFEFALPQSIADHAASPDAISLCVPGNNSWICLPAAMLGDKNGKAYYSANSPVSAFLAIRVGSSSNITAGERFSPGEDPKKSSMAYPLPATSFPASRVLPASAAKPILKPDMTVYFLIAGTIGIGMCAFLIKYGWSRYKSRRNG